MNTDNDLKIARAYEILLRELTLDEKHKNNLINRGFTLEKIEDLGFKSYPRMRSQLAKTVSKAVDVEGVPGFWKNANNEWQLAGESGLMIPVRNIDGMVVGIKIRSDADRVHKYTMLSSNPTRDKDGNIKFPSGAQGKNRIHYPLATRRIDAPLRITEGELKADIATLYSKTYTISISGVNMWQQAIDAAAKLQPTEIWLSFDSDKNKEVTTSTEGVTAEPYAVKKALGQLYKALSEAGYVVRIETWEPQWGKGIDDVLVQGFEDKITLMTDAEADEYSEEAMSDTMPSRWVYCIGTKRFVDLKTMSELDKEQFSDKFGDKFKAKRMSEKVIMHPSFPKVDLPIYEPKQPQIFTKNDVKYVNFWTPNNIIPEQGDASKFIQHCEYMIPDSHERKVVLDWMAHNIQHPGKKIHWAVLLQGVQGTGKSYFAHVMKSILGAMNISTPTNEMIHEPYTAWQKRCQLIIIEELMARGRLELMNKLKPMITQPTTSIREMFKAPYEQPNRFNLLMFTNHEDAIIIDETDRRYCVIYSPAMPKPTEYYDELWEWTDNNIGVIFNWFMTRDLSSFKPHSHAPMTEGKKKLINESKTPLQSWLREQIDTEVFPFSGDLVCLRDVEEILPKYLSQISAHALGKAMREIGCKLLGQIKIDGKGNVRIWAIKRGEFWALQDQASVRNKYMLDAGLKTNTSSNVMKIDKPM